MIRGSRFALVAALLVVPLSAIGEERPAGGPGGGGNAGVLRLLPPDSVREHSVAVGDRTVAYQSTAGTLSLYEGSGERSASVFYTAYVAKGADPATRPVTFVFNGGPGAASAYLHLGLVGPKRVQFGPGFDGAQPRLVDNPDTWLAFTDLVLIDPVGTGWSRPAKPDGGGGFWGVRRDASSIAKVIALYLSKNGRGLAPKYLLGESYGGFRAAKVASALQKEQGQVVAGLLLLSPFLDGALQFGAENSSLGTALRLPTLAAAELERTGRFSPEAMAEVERFAIREYLPALAGPALKGENARAFYAKLAQLTGVPEQVITRTRGFLPRSALDQIRSTEGKVVSRYDGAVVMHDPFPDQDRPGGDPVLDGFTRALGGAFVAYARDHLGFTTEMTYALLSGDVNGKWDWREGLGNFGQPSAVDDLRSLLALNPSLKLHVSHGYADLATPYGASRYILDHIPEAAAPRTELKLYRGGHMFYFDDGVRRAYTEDVRAFAFPRVNETPRTQ